MKRKVFCISLFLVSLFMLTPPSNTEAQLSLDVKVNKDNLDISYKDHPLSFPQNLSLREGDRGRINLRLPILPPVLYFPFGTISVTNNGVMTEEANALDTLIGGSFFLGLIPIPEMPFPIPFGNYAIDLTPLGRVKKPISDTDKALGGILASVLLTSSKAEFEIYIKLPFSETPVDVTETATPQNPKIVIPIEIPVQGPGLFEQEETANDRDPVLSTITIEFEFEEIITTVNITMQGPEELPATPITLPLPNGSYYLMLQPEGLGELPDFPVF